MWELIRLENSLSFSFTELCAIYSFLDKRFFTQGISLGKNRS
ncbi:hypothetical protein LEP1GSC035_4866 [Leptospira noguchii str. 2007001578]|uniref:Uncharacterized protein n=1 Tax=Leptospira noguchii str. 2007001578 TaxID=1049974 RepID=A0ABN0IXQ1_9LEPT|nr:hypothetical protein LEP1GSC035_4866 [Leptospira noguchii str. 2007001578]